jgi:hypothetical protein
MQTDRLQQILKRLTHISIIIDNEYDWQILRAHNDAPQSKGQSSENLPRFAIEHRLTSRIDCIG